MNNIDGIVSAIGELLSSTYKNFLALGGVSILSVIALIRVLKLKGGKAIPDSYESNGFRVKFVEEPVEQLVLLKQPEFEYSNPIRLKDLSFEVKDKNGKVLSEKKVSISAKTASGQEALVGNLTASTNSNGIATFSGVTIPFCGNLMISAECEGKQCASEVFDLPDTCGITKIIRFEKTPSIIGDSNNQLAPIIVKVLNANEWPVSGQKVKLSIYDEEHTDILQGLLSASSDEKGCALFSNLSVTRPGKWKLFAESGDVSAVSEEFTIPDISVNNIKFLKNPTDTEVKANLKPVIIKVKNSEGVPLAGKTITLTLRDKRGNEASLKGSLSLLSNENGEAVFDNLIIEKTGVYRIIASCEEIECESRRFEVTPLDLNLENYQYGSEEYWEVLKTNLLLHNAGDRITLNGEEL